MARDASKALGYDVIDGDVSVPEELANATRVADAVLYAVQLNQADAADVESSALRAIAQALIGTSKAFLYTSGCWYYGATGDRIADENAPANPPPANAARPGLERIVLDSAARGVRAIVVRPGDVFGEGRGLPAMFGDAARQRGVARTVGDGSNRWPVIHVDDLGRLYTLALEAAKPGDVFNAGDETAFTQREIAQAASRGAGRDGTTEVWPVDAAVAELGEWARALAMDQRITSARARSQLGWEASQVTILEDLERGSYVR
jgi:nucleoside-diphosphate-sugar epimerase